MRPLVSLVLALVKTVFAGIFVHEAMHYGVSSLMGGQGYVTFPGLVAGYYYFTVYPSPLWPSLLAGGLGTAIFMGIGWWLARWTPTHQDFHVELSRAVVAALHLGYCIAELWIFSNRPLYNILYPILATVCPLAVIFLYRDKLIEYVLDKQR